MKLELTEEEFKRLCETIEALTASYTRLKEVQIDFGAREMHEYWQTENAKWLAIGELFKTLGEVVAPIIKDQTTPKPVTPVSSRPPEPKHYNSPNKKEPVIV